MSEEPRRTRAGRRPARSAAPGHNPSLECPYIARNIPTYDILNAESLSRIEATADRILSEIGIEFREDPETVELFRAAGGEVRPVTDQSWNIRFAPGLIRSLLKTAPTRFTQHARNPARSVEIGGNAMVFAPSYGSPFIMETDGNRRYATLDDFQNLIKLGQSSPWLHHSGGTICEPTDIPVNKRHLDMVSSCSIPDDLVMATANRADEVLPLALEAAGVTFQRLGDQAAPRMAALAFHDGRKWALGLS